MVRDAARHFVPAADDRQQGGESRQLEEAGMLERRVIDARPPRVEYRLTDEGRRLKLVVDAVSSFAAPR